MTSFGERELGWRELLKSLGSTEDAVNDEEELSSVLKRLVQQSLEIENRLKDNGIHCIMEVKV